MRPVCKITGELVSSFVVEWGADITSCTGCQIWIPHVWSCKSVGVLKKHPETCRKNVTNCSPTDWRHNVESALFPCKSWINTELLFVSLGTELPQDNAWVETTTGMGGHLGLIWHVVLIATVLTVIIVCWCFNWTRAHTWADQNHMFLCECLCGPIKPELRLPLAHITQSSVHVKNIFPYSLGWCNTTSTCKVFSLTKGLDV